MCLFSYLPDLIHSLSITLILMLAAMMMGFILAVSLLLGRMSQYFLLTKSIDLFVFFIRGTPLLVQLFLIYYGASQFVWIRESWLWIFLHSPMACAILALSMNTACYTFILLQGAIHAVPKTEVAACEALGMSKWLAFRRIIFPRAMRLMLPAYSNEVIIILKCTSLASTITLLDLMGMTQELIDQTYDTMAFYLYAAFIYLLLNGVILGVFHLLNKRMTIPNQS